MQIVKQVPPRSLFSTVILPDMCSRITVLAIYRPIPVPDSLVVGAKIKARIISDSAFAFPPPEAYSCQPVWEA